MWLYKYSATGQSVTQTGNTGIAIYPFMPAECKGYKDHYTNGSCCQCSIPGGYKKNAINQMKTNPYLSAYCSPTLIDGTNALLPLAKENSTMIGAKNNASRITSQWETVRWKSELKNKVGMPFGAFFAASISFCHLPLVLLFRSRNLILASPSLDAIYAPPRFSEVAVYVTG